MPSVAPVLTDGVIVLNAYTNDDIPAHLAGEDEETARRFGWWPQTSTEVTVRDAFNRWASNWQTGGPTRTFAAREAATGRLVGGCELRLQPGGSAQVSYWTSASQRRCRHQQPGLPPGGGEGGLPPRQHLYRRGWHWHDPLPGVASKHLGRVKDQVRRAPSRIK
jgi:hypothetical protein